MFSVSLQKKIQPLTYLVKLETRLLCHLKLKTFNIQVFLVIRERSVPNLYVFVYECLSYSYEWLMRAKNIYDNKNSPNHD